MARLKLFAVSMITLGTLFGSAMTLFFTAALLGRAPIPVLVLIVLLTIGAGFFGWAFGPWFTDLLQGWVYHIEKLSFAEFQQRHPKVAAFLAETCKKNGIPVPMIRIVQDDNPTAYTYGSLPWNARIVVSRGLFRFLDTEEVNAVVAHELGHIKHYDFAVMTLATTALQVLYEIYWVFSRMKSRGRNNPGPIIALAAWFMWLVGTYLVLWLSRTREYLADAFSAEQLGDPAPLQRALVKIAYGMAEVQLTAGTQSQHLLQATRAMGISDPKAAPSLGNAVRALGATDGNLARKADVQDVEAPEWGALGGDVVYADGAGSSSFDPARIEPIFLFDLYNPWAAVSELSSTHPLTGKRIRALNEQAAELKKRALFSLQRVDAQGQALSNVRLYGKFFMEVIIYFLPWILPIPALLTLIFVPRAFGLVIMAVGLGMVVKGLYRYAGLAAFEKTTMYELMCDPYASPLRGRPVELEGEIVGKAAAGSMVGEDLTMKDRSGGLVMLNYEHWLPLFGNLYFGFSKAGTMFGQTGTATGWFRRSVFQFVDLHELRVGENQIGSYTRFWGMSAGFVVGAVGVVVLVLGMLVR